MDNVIYKNVFNLNNFIIILNFLYFLKKYKNIKKTNTFLFLNLILY